MEDEDDPKLVARKELATPQVQRLLKQFKKLESTNANTKTVIKNYEEIFGGACLDCDGFGTVAFTSILGGKEFSKYQRTEQPCPSCDGTGKKIP